MNIENINERLLRTERERDEAQGANILNRNALRSAKAEIARLRASQNERAIADVPFEGGIDGAMRAAVGEIARLRAEVECHSLNHDDALDLLDTERAAVARLRASQNERAITELTTLDAYLRDGQGYDSIDSGAFAVVTQAINARIAALRAETPAAAAPPVTPPADAPSRPSGLALEHFAEVMRQENATLTDIRRAVRLLLDDAIAARKDGGA